MFHLRVTLIAGLCAGQLSVAAGAPAPKSAPSALLFIPKMTTRVETSHHRRNQLDIIRSQSLLAAALRTLKIEDLPVLKTQTDPNGWLRRNFKAEYLDGTGVMRLSLLAGTDREQAIIVNAVARAYAKAEGPEHDRRLEKLFKARRARLQERRASLVAVKRELEKKASSAHDKRARMALERLEQHKQLLEGEIAGLEDTIKRTEAALQTSFQLLELAEVPPK